MPRRPNGFTLIEALVVLLIVAVLAAIAVPAWTHARAAALSGSIRAELAATLLDAVRHSSIGGSQVVVCASNGSGQCSGQSNWDPGWIAFADINRDGHYDPNETLLAHRQRLPDGVHLRTTVGRPRLVVRPGSGTIGSNVTFTLCDARGPQKATTLVLSNAGNLRSSTPSAAAARSCAYGG